MRQTSKNRKREGHSRNERAYAVILIPALALVLGGGVGCEMPPSSIDTVDDDIIESDLGVATFAGGCFWCVESAFEDLPGVSSAISGFTGGMEADPTYNEVSSGQTSHIEAVQVSFDPARITYDDLLWVFWRQIDPTDDGGQFADRGSQYRTAIFIHDAAQRSQAEASLREHDLSGRFGEPIVTEIRDAGPFYAAEDYHQDYFRTNPERYQTYRSGSGRDRYLESIWGDEPHGSHAYADRLELEYVAPSNDELREQLTPLQFRVTRENGTEPPFNNEYWDNHGEGIYVDIISGEPLFSSTHKYESGTGWPSFYTPLVPENIIEVTDDSHGMVRTEVRSRLADSHLGHLFNDGPDPTGLRYCINSASLRFIESSSLDAEGYGHYQHVFDAM